MRSVWLCLRDCRCASARTASADTSPKREIWDYNRRSCARQVWVWISTTRKTGKPCNKWVRRERPLLRPLLVEFGHSARAALHESGLTFLHEGAHAFAAV